MRSKARTFYLASLFLPPAVRRDVQMVYAYYRLVDDLVDDPPPTMGRSEILRTLDEWENVVVTGGGSTQPLLDELLRIVEQYRINPAHLRMILQGARLDLDAVPVETSADLRNYAVLVAGSVGMVMAPIMGDHEGTGRQAACDLGVAMQLTNVLRDVHEDALRGRVYLPLTELRAAGITMQALQERTAAEPLRCIVERTAGHARALYESGRGGLLYIDSASRFAALIAAALYEKILDKIEQQGFDVLTTRAQLSSVEKWRVTVPMYLQHRLAKGL